MNRFNRSQQALLSFLVLFAPHLFAETFHEFRIKRAPVFEFTEKPRVSREGDLLQITFATKAACDVTWAF